MDEGGVEEQTRSARATLNPLMSVEENVLKMDQTEGKGVSF